MSKKFVTYDSKHFIKFGTRKISIVLFYNKLNEILQIGFTTSQSQKTWINVSDILSQKEQYGESFLLIWWRKSLNAIALWKSLK